MIRSIDYISPSIYNNEMDILANTNDFDHPFYAFMLDGSKQSE